MTIPHNHVAIIGTGFGGIATAVRLQKAGVDDFALIDRAGDVGGVWRDNDYPGAAVDVRATSTPSRSPRTRTGVPPSPSNPSYMPTCGASPIDSICAAGSSSIAPSRRCAESSSPRRAAR
jgi:cation diffusion facilitator CzcD-associated flavoprotein CzcO